MTETAQTTSSEPVYSRTRRRVSESTYGEFIRGKIGGNNVWIRADWNLSGHLLDHLDRQESVTTNLTSNTANELSRVSRGFGTTAIHHDQFQKLSSRWVYSSFISLAIWFPCSIERQRRRTKEEISPDPSGRNTNQR
jgi:hypothetical protein